MLGIYRATSTGVGGETAVSEGVASRYNLLAELHIGLPGPGGGCEVAVPE